MSHRTPTQTSWRETRPDRLTDPFLRTLDNLLASAPARDFHRRATAIAPKRFYKSWLGINFSGATILSIKAYYSFYEDLSEPTVRELFLDDQIARDFSAARETASSRFLTDPTLPGSGSTFCIKLDLERRPTFGFFLRQRGAPKGRFDLYGPRGHHSKEYSYFSTTGLKQRLARESGLSLLARCETVEIGVGAGHGLPGRQEHTKFNVLGNFPVLRPLLFSSTEDTVISRVEQRYRLRAACGGLYSGEGERSVYLVNPQPSTRGDVTTLEAIYGCRPGS